MPGRQSCQGWTTKGSRNISTLEDNTLPGQLVQIGSLDLRMPHKAIITPCLVIGNNINDIGPISRRYGESAEEEKRGPNGDNYFLFHRFFRLLHSVIHFKFTNLLPRICYRCFSVDGNRLRTTQLITFSVNNQKERIWLKYIKPFKIRVKKNGGVKESRTPDLPIANATLYQLSYDPTHANATDPCREVQA